MFGKQPAKQTSAKEFDLDELLNSTLKDVDDDLDMNDPDLLVKKKSIFSLCFNLLFSNIIYRNNFKNYLLLHQNLNLNHFQKSLKYKLWKLILILMRL